LGQLKQLLSVSFCSCLVTNLAFSNITLLKLSIGHKSKTF